MNSMVLGIDTGYEAVKVHKMMRAYTRNKDHSSENDLQKEADQRKNYSSYSVLNDISSKICGQMQQLKGK